MEWKKMVKNAMKHKGITGVALSAKMGKGGKYANNLLCAGTSPTLDTLQSIADAMGYDLAVSFVDRDTGEVIKA